MKYYTLTQMTGETSVDVRMELEKDKPQEAMLLGMLVGRCIRKGLPRPEVISEGGEVRGLIIPIETLVHLACGLPGGEEEYQQAGE